MNITNIFALVAFVVKNCFTLLYCATQGKNNPNKQNTQQNHITHGEIPHARQNALHTRTLSAYDKTHKHTTKLQKRLDALLGTPILRQAFFFVFLLLTKNPRRPNRRHHRHRHHRRRLRHRS